MGQKNRLALITGASMGLGRAFAVECARRGMDLILSSLPGEGLPETSESIARDAGVLVGHIEGDLTEDATLEAIRSLLRARPRGPRLLVNNAGLGGVGLFSDLPLEHHVATVELNAVALVKMTALFLEESADGDGLRILNVASLGSFFPMPSLSVYSATKGFVLDFSLALSAELAGRASVSVLCPNAILTKACVDGYASDFGLAARLACMRPEDVARIALDGAGRGKAVIVPGLFNRIIAALSRFVPRGLAMRVIRHYWGGFADRDESVRPRASAVSARAGGASEAGRPAVAGSARS